MSSSLAPYHGVSLAKEGLGLQTDWSDSKVEESSELRDPVGDPDPSYA